MQDVRKEQTQPQTPSISGQNENEAKEEHQNNMQRGFPKGEREETDSFRLTISKTFSRTWTSTPSDNI